MRSQVGRRRSKENEAALNMFELERLMRIERNQQMLAGMGLVHQAEQLVASIKPQARRRSDPDLGLAKNVKKQQLQPTRRSRRLASLPVELLLQPQQTGSEMMLQQQGSRSTIQAINKEQVQQLDPNLHHGHNLHRINSMSEKALIRRAWKITNLGKLKSFIQVLEAAGVDTVLVEARAALAALANPQ